MKIIYRGFKDIYPDEVQHLFSQREDSNLMGNSVGYFSNLEFTAQSYAFTNFKKFGIFYSYEFSGTNPLVIFEGKDFSWENGGIKIFNKNLIKELKRDFLEKTELSNSLFDLGYDSVQLGSSFDKNDDMIAIKDSTLINPISLSIATKEKNQELIKIGDLGYDKSSYDLIFNESSAFNYYPIFKIPMGDVEIVSSILKNIK